LRQGIDLYSKIMTKTSIMPRTIHLIHACRLG